MKLTDHQKRVLAAILALEEKHGCRWWSRDAIGSIVEAGGYHQVIQKSTIRILKLAGLVMTERSGFSPEVLQAIRCTCGCHYWGLTELGRQTAQSIGVKWSEHSRKRVEEARIDNYHGRYLDEDEPWDFDSDDDDDDDGDGPNPIFPAPAGQPCLQES
jgi:hypothetical protein